MTGAVGDGLLLLWSDEDEEVVASAGATRKATPAKVRITATRTVLHCHFAIAWDGERRVFLVRRRGSILVTRGEVCVVLVVADDGS